LTVMHMCMMLYTYCNENNTNSNSEEFRKDLRGPG